MSDETHHQVAALAYVDPPEVVELFVDVLALRQELSALSATVIYKNSRVSHTIWSKNKG